MPIATILGLALKALGLTSWAESLLKTAQDKQAGREEQHTADVEASVKEANNAARTDEANSQLSNDQLAAKLYKSNTNG